MAPELETSPGSALENFTLQTHTETSAADTDLTISLPAVAIRKMLFVAVRYSAAVTKTVTITVTSGAGTSFLLPSIVVTADVDGISIFAGDVTLGAKDTVAIKAPAGGGVVTADLMVYSKVK